MDNKDININLRFLQLYADFLNAIVTFKGRNKDNDEDFCCKILSSCLTEMDSFSVDFRAYSDCTFDVNDIVKCFNNLKECKSYKDLPDLRSTLMIDFDSKRLFLVYRLRVWLDLPF